ncbi:MAG TPA: malto-oligosyltrehalose synthase [Dermatophilaceae bacterium]|nr:malto-oligosyltrehalose synthase [Dermatophilaceae bacterium]
MTTATSTYRLQLHAGFTFADAEAQVPYLASLGVSHLYLSPILQAVPGSAHGYDVLDHTRVATDLGGEPALRSLANAAHEHELGLVVDVVPNHMALVAPESANRPLWQVLKEGRDAATAQWFDIDWKSGGGRLGLPILGGSLAEAVEAGELVLDELDGEPVIRYHEHVFPLAIGTEGGPGADVAEVLQRQHYQLASWRDTDAMLNYRRFFEVDQLIAVRVELPEVFEATHRLLLDLNRDGTIDGFRIDHPDGLADPEGYLQQLRKASRPGTLIWVEKILEGEERLPLSWACDGTTGYDAMFVVQTALVDPAPLATLDRTWRDAGGDPDVAGAVEQAKRHVVRLSLGPEVERLTRRAREALPGQDPERLREAVVELLVAGEVYRAYVRPEERLSALARARIQDAYAVAVASRPDLAPELQLLAQLATAQEDDGVAAVDFAVRLQQTWGPVMAKGIEDTTFYRWHRLTALNEVGGEPGVVDHASAEPMHAWAVNQQEHWPRGMTTLSTHDTKRSEDVRARILAVAGDEKSWADCSAVFHAAADEAGVDRATAHLLWQTLVGAGFIETERLHGYLLKAVREAKQLTAWIDGDQAYEQRVLALADRAVEPGPMRSAVERALAAGSDAVRATTLSAKLLQLCLPGVPDTYQGCEVVDLSLVDPDNRRPVDYGVRTQRLARLDEGYPAEDLDDEKLLLTSRVLRLRKANPAVFGEGAAYEPVQSDSEHLLGFVRARPASWVASALRIGRQARVVALATRAPFRLAAGGGWGEAKLALPPGDWRDELTSRSFTGGEIPCAAVLSAMPVAVLVQS